MLKNTTVPDSSTAPRPELIKRPLLQWILFLAGVVLVIAGALKGYDLLRGAVTKNYFFHTTEVLSELVAGVWFISSVAGYYAVRAGALLFTLFLGVSLHDAWQGQVNCGCFGPVPMNPWITAGMDAVILLLMVAAISKYPKNYPATAWRKVLSGIVAVGILAGLIGGKVYLQPGMLHSNGTITGGHGVIFMQPPAWDSKRFPAADYIPGSRAIMHGKWLAVIYFHTCPICQSAIASISRHLKHSSDHNVALIQLPPYGSLPKGLASANMLRLGFENTHIWRPPFLPVLVDLDNGVVTRVRSYVPGNWFGF